MGRLKRTKESNVKESNVLDVKKIRVRHVVDTTSLVELNANLTDRQKRRLGATPFKWLVEIETKIKISGVLLRELVSRWEECSRGFRVGTRVVSFTTLDVYIALGLPIVGADVSLDDYEDCRVKHLFKGKEITVEGIIEKLGELNSDEDVEDYCRIYILLAFAVLYFPRTTRVLFSVPFKLLDDLDALKTYNWGVAVYDFLVGSLSRAATNYSETKNSAQLHIAGCAAVLQIWVVEHLSLRPTSKVTLFPRIIAWTDVDGGFIKIAEAFKRNKLVEDLVASEEDRQAIGEAEGGFRHFKNHNFDINNLLIEHEMLLAQNKEFQKRISSVEHEVKILKNLAFEQMVTMSKRSVGEGTEKEVVGNPVCNFKNHNFDINNLLIEHEMLLAQNKEFQKRISSVEHEVKILKNLVEQMVTMSKRSVGEGTEKKVLGNPVCLTTPVGSLSLRNKDEKQPNKKLLQRLYTFCTSRTALNPSEILISFNDQYLTGHDIQCMKPRSWLNNMVIMLAVAVMNEDQFERGGVRSRFLFSSVFVERIVGELQSFRVGQQKKWTKRTFYALLPSTNNSLDDIRPCKLIFAPAIYESHWFCYVLDQERMKMFLLDSLGHKRGEDKQLLDHAMRVRFEDLLALLYPTINRNGTSLEVIYENLPTQHNFHDCGIYVLKYMEIWDGVTKWGDKTMPDYTLGEIVDFRREYVCRWVLHPKNARRLIVLEDAKLPKDLSMAPSL